MGTAIHQPTVLLFGQMGWASARSVNFGDLVRGFAIHGSKPVAPGLVAHDDENPVLGIATRRSADRCIKNLGNELHRDWVGLQAPLRASSIDRLK